MQATARAVDRGDSPLAIRLRTKASRSRRSRAAHITPLLLREGRERREIARVALDGVGRHAPDIPQIRQIAVDRHDVASLPQSRLPAQHPFRAKNASEGNHPPRRSKRMRHDAAPFIRDRAEMLESADRDCQRRRQLPRSRPPGIRSTGATGCDASGSTISVVSAVAPQRPS